MTSPASSRLTQLEPVSAPPAAEQGQAPQGRLQVLDALRGFAILSIMLVHHIEHFDYWHKPEGFPGWLVRLDQWVWDSLFFLFSGKSYAIFALLFGLTFSLQCARQEKLGRPFGARFAWRLLLLLGFGVVNSAFYQGDILMFYAVIGLVLIPARRLSSRGLVLAAALLLLQPFHWPALAAGIADPAAFTPDPRSWHYFGLSGAYLSGSSFLDTLAGNLSNGRLGVALWTWEAGRVPQTAALFLLGLLAGRHGLFLGGPEARRFWLRALPVAIVAFCALFVLGRVLSAESLGKAVMQPAGTILGSLSNMAFMVVLVSSFALLYWRGLLGWCKGLLEPLGRMSLSNYVLQSLVGAFIYHGYGLGLYRHTGATLCLLIGVALALGQVALCRWWLRGHAQGPLEALWHRLTWLRG